MGIKTNLLEYIIPEIKSITPSGGTVLDIMAGSNAVSYALKEFFTVFTNDIQTYSYAISKAIIENQSVTISAASAKKDLLSFYNDNLSSKHYHYFEDTYSFTYFSDKQCIDIDALRYAIEQIEDENLKNLYLFALMGAMCKVQSTPGHFAQFMPATHSRIIPLQNMNLLDVFYDKCDLYSELFFNDKKNKAYNMDFHDLLTCTEIPKVDTIYLDSPYTQEQYSRFYHILETVVKYDYPEVNFKAKYRNDRFQSNFCYKGKVETEFIFIFEYCQKTSTNLLISYSNKGLVPVERLKDLASSYFSSVSLQYIDYKHSTQGKGSNKLKEILLSCIC